MAACTGHWLGMAWWGYVVGDTCAGLGIRPLAAAAKVWRVVSGWTIIGGLALAGCGHIIAVLTRLGAAQVPLRQCHLVDGAGTG